MESADLLAPSGTPGGVDWADNTDILSGGLPPQEVKANADGTKVIIDYSMSDEGYLSITTTVLKVDTVTRTVPKGVANRRHWAKFGECAGKPAGLERGVSTVSSDQINVEWILPDNGDDADEDDTNYAEQAARDIQSRLKAERFRKRQEERKLGVANWAQMMSLEAARKDPNAPQAPGLRAPEASSPGPGGKYVPPSKRPGATGSGPSDGSYTRDDSATVRISNVSRSTEEADLEELCKTFGPIRRIFLSRDRETRESKGFAFVAFQNKVDAEKCIRRLDGYGYDHLILSVEWSKPKEPREGEAARPSFSR